MSVSNIVKSCFKANFDNVVEIISEALVEEKVHPDDIFPTVTQILEELFLIHLEQICTTVIGQDTSSSENSSTESEISSELSSEEL